MNPWHLIRGSFLALALALVASCGAPLVDLSEAERSFKPADYQTVFERWSRELQILPVDGIENVLTARATHLSWEFRWAYVVKEAHDLRLSPAEREAHNQRELARLREGERVELCVDREAVEHRLADERFRRGVEEELARRVDVADRVISPDQDRGHRQRGPERVVVHQAASLRGVRASGRSASTRFGSGDDSTARRRSAGVPASSMYQPRCLRITRLPRSAP